MVGLVDFVGDVEEGLGRDAADVETGAAEGSPLLDADSVEAQLGGLDGCHISCVKKRLPPGPPPMTAKSKALVEKWKTGLLEAKILNIIIIN